ncbi:MAG: hypothetical protein ACI9R3_002906 [Verrucomicrobiales bacterium]|jgi:hypothetical protein
MTRDRAKRRGIFTAVAALFIVAWVIAYYAFDDQLMVPPELEPSIPRDSAGAENVIALLSLELTDGDRTEEEEQRLSDWALAREIDADALRSLQLVVASESDAFAAIYSHLQSNNTLRFPEYTTYDFAADHPVDRLWKLPELLIHKAAIARATGNHAEALNHALDGLRLSSSFASGGGTVLNLLLASKGRYRSLVAVERILVSANSLDIDRAVLKELNDPTLQVTTAALQETLLTEFQWALTVHENGGVVADYDLLRKYLMLPEPDSFVWKFPAPFRKANRSLNLYASFTLEIVANLEVPICERDWPVYDELYEFSVEFSPWDPNSIGKIFAHQSYNLFDGTCDENLRSNILLEALRVTAAVRLFEDTQGNLPDELDELVPNFLAAVPLDIADGEQLRYDSSRRIVYSLGSDAIDDGGAENSDQPFDMSGSDDLVLHIPNLGDASKPTRVD